MNIKEIRFEITKNTTYTVVMNVENGYEMPVTPEDLIDTVNAIKNNPSIELDLDMMFHTDSEVFVSEYSITEEAN